MGGWPWGGHQTRSLHHGPPASQLPAAGPWKLVEPSRVGAGWATRGRQSPIVLSTAHRFIQEPRVKCTAGSRVDSALNSFGIAGGATEAKGSLGWGGVTATWGRGLGHPWRRGQEAAAEPRLMTLIHTKRNHNYFQTPSQNQTSTGSLGRAERVCVRWGVRAGELVFYPLPDFHLLSAPIHSELTDSIAFSRGKEPAQCRGLFRSTLAHRALGNVQE